MKTRFTLLLLWLLPALYLQAQIDLQLELISDVFSSPVDIASAGDERLFIVEKGGRILIMSADGTVNPTPFLDIDDLVNSVANERGLLGLVFHPAYAENGYFFVNYTNNSGHTTVARYQVSPDDPDVADPASAHILFTVTQPFSNHNAGDLNFGPDGYLYIALGDGGSGGDPNGNGQKRNTMLGKLLRLDVDQGDPYAIPTDNPFQQDTATLDEIWALGLRNPWRFSFDRLTGDLWIADVGQGSWEEVNFTPAGSTGGENYGWRCYEGMVAFNTGGCGGALDYDFPILQYESELPNGCSITGGFVYRGEAFPLLYGKYIYSDYCSSKIWALSRNEGGEWVNEELHDGPNFQYVTFGEDYRGELYLGTLGGSIYRVRDQTTSTGEATLGAKVQLRPNPFDQFISLEGSLPEAGWYQLQLFNAQGKSVWQANEQLETTFSKKISTEQLARGVYFLVIERKGARQVMKVIKQ